MSLREAPKVLNYGDLISSGNSRLKGLKIIHSEGKQQRQRGWSSVHGKGDIPEAIDSSKTPFRPLILLVPPKLLGTHEDTIGDPNNPKWVPDGRNESGFAEIDFSNGWDGSPIAVAAYTLCKGNGILNTQVYSSIYRALVTKGGMGIIDSLIYGDLGVLDGHHRVKMAAESLTQRLKYVPVQLIPYLFDNSVVLNTWHSDGNIWTAEQVFECFKTPNKYADAKRTKFGVVGTDGVTRRILDTQPSIKIPLKSLV